MLIRAEAEGTDTYELNRNLVLTDGARADSVPNLEIETGEIKGAGHAFCRPAGSTTCSCSTCSRAASREDEAKRLVVRGFFADIIREIPLADLRDEITAAIEDELATTAYAAPTQQTPRHSPARARRTDPMSTLEIKGLRSRSRPRTAPRRSCAGSTSP